MFLRSNNRKKFLFLINISLVFLLACLSPCYLRAQKKAEGPAYLGVLDKILKKGLKEEGAFSLLEKITSVGPRLTGSPQTAAAVELMNQLMQDLGFSDVHLEPITVNHWVRGAPEEAKLVSSLLGSIPLNICAIGGSIATPETGITSQVIEVKSFEELHTARQKAKGKIVFFNRAMDPTLLDTFRAYGQAASQRVAGAVEAAKVGALAVLVRSLTTRVDDFPHTGLMRYASKIPRIPAACISTKGANLLSEGLKKDPSLNVHIKLNCQDLSPVTSHNVVGQITGSEKPQEIILLGGHLDSWDMGTGAHDDGAGCAQAVEALRLLKEQRLKPKRTIRAVMFMNEEFGGTGGKDYAQAKERKGEAHLAAIESDRGGFIPLGFGVGAGSQTVKRLQSWQYLLEHMGMYWIHRGGGGVDIAPLAQQGTVLIGLVPDCQRYFDVHHSDRDVLERVNPRELELGAIAMAIFAYVLSQEGI